MYTPFLFKIINLFNKSAFLDNLLHQVLVIYFFLEYDKTIGISLVNELDDELKTKPSTSNEIFEKYTIFINNTVKDILINKDEFESIYETFNSNITNMELLLNAINNTSIVDVLYCEYFNNSKLKHNIKEFNQYFTEKKYIDYINNIINIKNCKSICNLFSGCGRFINYNYNNTINYFLFDNNDIINKICYFNLLMKHKNIQNIQINNKNIIANENNMKYDLIIADIPEDIKNLIYANCNSQIKSLKIRGTKSEPLIIQYISQIINKNGVAIIIVPNSLLFGNSNQHIETRKYLIENFSIKIINLDNKKSIIYLDTTKSNIITFSFFNNDNIYFKTINEIKNNKYSLFYDNYLKINTVTTTTKYIKDIINIYNKEDIKNEIIEIICNIDKNSNTNILYSFKNQFNIDTFNNIIDYDYLFVTKNNSLYSQEFINYFLLNLFTIYKNNIIKGKMKQLDINLINELQIDIPTQDIHKNIINYYKNNNVIDKINNNQIDNLELIKKNIISSYILNKETKQIKELCNINHESSQINTIYINRNSNNAGYVNLTSTPIENSTNNYYFHINNNNIIQDYFYFMLLYFENEFVKLANLNKTISLSKKSLEEFNIPIITIDEQKILIEKINSINTCIANYIDFNNKNNQLLIKLI